MSYIKQLFSILVLFSAMNTCLNAQAEVISGVEKLILTDGSILIGQSIDETGSQVNFQILGGPLIQIEKDDIQEIQKEDSGTDKKGTVFFSNGKRLQSKGVYNIFQANVNFTNSSGVDDALGGFSFNIAVGKHINRFLSVGGGIGLDVFNGSNSNAYTFIPVYLDVRGFPFQKTTSFYYALNAGYSFGTDLFNTFNADGDYSGGLNIKPSVGVRFASRKKSQFTIEFGYKYQSTYTEYRIVSPRDGTRFFEEDIQFIRPNIGFGWIF